MAAQEMEGWPSQMNVRQPRNYPWRRPEPSKKGAMGIIWTQVFPTLPADSKPEPH